MLAQTKIAPVKSAILIIYNWFNYLTINDLLSYTEMAEDVFKYLICSDFSNNITEVEDTLAEILRDEIAGELLCYPLLHTMDGIKRMPQGFIVAYVADNDIAGL